MYSKVWCRPNVRPGCASTAKCMLLSMQEGQREFKGPRIFSCDSTVKMQIRKVVSKTNEVIARKRFETVITRDFSARFFL
jgi:hypothetical protein